MYVLYNEKNIICYDLNSQTNEMINLEHDAADLQWYANYLYVGCPEANTETGLIQVFLNPFKV